MNCRSPLQPVNGTLGNYSSQRFGSSVSFGCVDGYRPSAIMTSMCANTSTWTPAPGKHNCTLVIGNEVAKWFLGTCACMQVSVLSFAIHQSLNYEFIQIT